MKNISTHWSFITKNISPSLLAAVGVGFICLFTLFVQPIRGVADNGDFFRVAYSNGLYYFPNYDSNYFGYFVSKYGILNDYNENGTLIFTSQSLIIRLAILLNKLLYSHTIFDIRFQAGIYVVLLMVGVFLLVEAVTFRVERFKGYLIAIIAMLIFADSAYTEYFNSLYGESLMYVSIVLIAASCLLIYRNRYPFWFTTSLYYISSLFFITSKQQNAPLALILGAIGLIFLFVYKKRVQFWLIISASLLLSMTGLAGFSLISDQFKDINQYQAMSRGVLLHAKSPEGALDAFSMNRQYALLKGTTYYQEYTSIGVASSSLQKNFYTKYGFVSIASYYLTHMNQLADLLNLAARDWLQVRPTYLGNFERSSGYKFGSHTSFFSLYSYFCQWAVPRKFGFFVFWSFSLLGLYFPSFLDALRGKRQGNLLLRYILVGGFLIMELFATLTSLIGDGDADVAKYLFLFPITFSCLFFMALSDLISGHLFRNHELRVSMPKPLSYPTSRERSVGGNQR